MESRVWVKLLLVSIVLTSLGVCSGENGPYIDGPNERIVKSNSNFTLICSGIGPFHWKFPDSGMTLFWMDSGESESTLSAINVHFLDTGYFECHTDFGFAETYIFVTDEDNLLALGNDTFLSPIQFQNITIPCKPTSPDVHVELLVNGEKAETEHYDPKKGFTLFFSTMKNCCDLSCIARKGDKEISQEIRLLPQDPCTSALIPEISQSAIHHLVIGQSAVLSCSVRPEDDSIFRMDWLIPDSSSSVGRVSIKETYCYLQHNLISGSRICEKTLVIKEVGKNDEGNYTCKVTDRCNQIEEMTSFVKIYPKGYTFLNMSVHSNVITVFAMEKAIWIVDLFAFPNASVEWLDAKGQEVIKSPLKDKFFTKIQGSKVVLTIFNVTFSDAGNYSVIAQNEGGNASLQLELIVLDIPMVEVPNVRNLKKIGVAVNITCRSLGFPTPEIEWSFQKCDFLSDFHCTENDFKKITEKSRTRKLTDYSVEATFELSMKEPGRLKCSSSNEIGTDEVIENILVSDVPEGFRVSKTPEEIVVGDNVTLRCSIATYEYLKRLRWYRSDKQLSDVGSMTTFRNGKYSFSKEVMLINVNRSFSGEYVCESRTHSNETQKRVLDIKVLDAVHPFFSKCNLTNSEVTLSSWQPIAWRCEGSGVPTPSILWYKDDKLLSKDMLNYELLENNQTLVVKSLTFYEEGKYFCRIQNRIGVVEKFIVLKLEEHGNFQRNLIIGVSILSAILLVFILKLLMVIIRIRKEKKDLALVGLKHFKKGMTEYINPDLPLDEQTNLLPYDSKWEFQRKNLKLGEQLGAGAFGTVMKGEALGLEKGGKSTTVAVKMAKYVDDPSSIKALASELKILIHLGKHLNVVNLLGACTKNLTKKELLVIVEYCKHGNLHDHLLKNRQTFVNEIDPETGEIDPGRGRRSDVGYQSRIRYANLTFPISEESEPENVSTCSTSVDNFSQTFECSDVDGCSLKVDTNFPEKKESKPIKTSTLLCWAFQISRGMEYLASRRVLHGDLAARNILLAENNVVKICDFGLAKSIYKNPEYQKSKGSLLPVKWMAIESLRDQVFSTQSDVWSFGIVLWELFSLSMTPYPGLQDVKDLLFELCRGNRLKKPPYATQKLYEVMLECWNGSPSRRPSFHELVQKLGDLMENNMREHYIQMNCPFQENSCSDGDLLNNLRPPSYSQHPNYINYLAAKDLYEREIVPRGTCVENELYLVPRHNSNCVFNPNYFFDAGSDRKPETSVQEVSTVVR